MENHAGIYMADKLRLGDSVYWEAENKSGVVVSVFDTTVDVVAKVLFPSGKMLDILANDLELICDDAEE